MNHQKTKQTSWIVGVLSSVMWFSGLAFAHPQVATPPFAQEILDRLDQLEAKIDSQSTDLRSVTQNWDKELDSNNGDIAAGREGCDSDRFTCLFGDTAVRDNETGLVWDRSPDNTSGTGNDGKYVWSSPVSFCVAREIGGRGGFHLPLMPQLSSLVDSDSMLCLSGGPCLPDGHPFLNVQSDRYWSATTNASSPVLAHNVDFTDGNLGSASNKTTFKFNWWCVRGGQSFDGNTHDTLH
jgi:hypothetical protein